MLELEPIGVKRLAGNQRLGFYFFEPLAPPRQPPAAVCRVAQHRNANMIEVNPYLVCPARLKPDLEKRRLLKHLANREVGDGLTPSLDDRHRCPVGGVTSDGLVNRAFSVWGNPLHNRQVAALDAAGLEGLREAAVNNVRLGDDEEPRGVLIEPVDDAGALDAADSRKLAAAVVKKCGDHGALTVSGTGMNHHARRLVHHEKVLVLKTDIKRNILGFEAVRLGRGNFNFEPRAGRHFMARLDAGLAVHEYTPLAYQSLYSRAGELVKLAGKIGVQARGPLRALPVKLTWIHAAF